MLFKIKGYRKYFLKLLFSFIAIFLGPVVIMGFIWYSMVINQEKNAFLKSQRDRIIEISAAIEREINEIESGLVILQLDLADRGYNVTDQVRSKSLMAKTISKFIKDYRVVYSVYFLDSIKGQLYSTVSGLYDFSSFYDTEWFAPSDAQFYSQRLAPRYNYNKSFLDSIRDTSMEAIFPSRKVMTVVTAGASGYYLAANVNIESLYQAILKAYSLDRRNEEFFLIGIDDKILFGPESKLMYESFPVPIDRQSVSLSQTVYRDGNGYVVAPLKYPNLYCAVSFPKESMYTVSRGYGMYIIGICAFFILLLFCISRIMANRLYRPIQRLFSEIRQTPAGSGYDDHDGEIETLRHVFKEMNTICVTAEHKESEYRATMLQATFRMLIDDLITQENFIAGNRTFFQGIEDGRFQIAICKFRERIGGDDERAFGLFFIRFYELISNYLQAVTKCVFTVIQADCFAMMFSCPTAADLEGIKTLLFKTICDLTEYPLYLSSSGAFGIGTNMADELLACRNRIRVAVFFDLPETLLTETALGRDIEFNHGDERAYANCLRDAVTSGNAALVKKHLSSLRLELTAAGDPDYATAVCLRILDQLDDGLSIAKTAGKDVCRECEAKRTLNGMLGYMEEALISAIGTAHSNSTMSGFYCDEAKRYLRENYMKYMNITDVADYLGISYPYLCKVFKTQQEGNGKLGEYLNAIRIEKSKELLSLTNESLPLVARKVGYGNVQSFQRFFKKYEKMTPGDYRILQRTSRSCSGQ